MILRKRWNPKNMIIFLSLLLLIMVAFNVAAGMRPTEAATPQKFISVMVKDGDNLWSIAAKYQPNTDPRQVVNEIIQLNDLNHSKIYPGQVIDVPND